MTININELRRLAQAATPGPWWVNQDGLNHGFERGVIEINALDWWALAGVWAVNEGKPSDEGSANAAFIAAANPAAIIKILDRLEAAENERDWHAERCEDAMNECDALRAKIKEMEKQELGFRERCAPSSSTGYSNRFPLYALPGAKGE